MNFSKALVMAVLCLALFSQEAHSWNSGLRRFGPVNPITDPDMAADCAAATDFETRVMPCRMEQAMELFKFIEWTTMGPACCSLALDEFNYCTRPRLLAASPNSTVLPKLPAYLQKYCVK